MLVIAVGNNTLIGREDMIVKPIDETLTPLQSKLEKVARKIQEIGWFFAFLMIFTLFLRFFIAKFYNSTNDSIRDQSIELLGYWTIGVTIAIVAVPEGLPIVVLIALANTVKKMLTDQNFVRHLSSVEKLGLVNEICIGKTGTITMNRLSVVKMWAGLDIRVKAYDSRYDWKEFFNNDY